MARPSTGANLNIAQLEQILNQRRNELAKLEQQKNDLQRRLDDVSREIERVGGGVLGGGAMGGGAIGAGVIGGGAIGGGGFGGAVQMPRRRGRPPGRPRLQPAMGGAPTGNGGASGGGRAARAHNAKSLPDTLEEVLRGTGRPMRVPEIAEAVLGTGYRSNAANFRAIVNQTLIKERKRFAPSGERGIYQLARQI